MFDASTTALVMNSEKLMNSATSTICARNPHACSARNPMVMVMPHQSAMKIKTMLAISRITFHPISTIGRSLRRPAMSKVLPSEMFMRMPESQSVRAENHMARFAMSATQPSKFMVGMYPHAAEPIQPFVVGGSEAVFGPVFCGAVGALELSGTNPGRAGGGAAPAPPASTADTGTNSTPATTLKMRMPTTLFVNDFGRLGILIDDEVEIELGGSGSSTVDILGFNEDAGRMVGKSAVPERAGKADNDGLRRVHREAFRKGYPRALIAGFLYLYRAESVAFSFKRTGSITAADDGVDDVGAEVTRNHERVGRRSLVRSRIGYRERIEVLCPLSRQERCVH